MQDNTFQTEDGTIEIDFDSLNTPTENLVAMFPLACNIR